MDGIDSKALYNFSYGVYIVSTEHGGKMNGQIADAAMQISGTPITLAVSINKENLTHELISASGKFSVSILEEDVPMPFIGTFGFKSGRAIDKFADAEHIIAPNGIPAVKQWCLAALSTNVIGKIDVHTHTIFVGEVVASEVFKQGTPLTYANYHLIKKGKSPKTAPTAVFNDMK